MTRRAILAAIVTYTARTQAARFAPVRAEFAQREIAMAVRFQQKLVIPSAAHPLVDRTALLERIDRAVGSKALVALAAPAGWGKTTLLAQWAKRGTLPVAWYSLDATDRDPHLFLDYLLHAVRPYIRDAVDFIAQLAATPPSGLSDLFRVVAVAIAHTPTPFALVLDDFHLIEGDSAATQPGTASIFTLLMSLIDYAPGCHLVIASRALPDLHGIVRVIAQQRAALFDYGALQFNCLFVARQGGWPRASANTRSLKRHSSSSRAPCEAWGSLAVRRPPHC